ncbi:nuclease [Ancylobacter sp. IITR112]|uniref:nuclease n=1 Tax=Ancylobacter sp. IITR112 TaxID=3138073 RepID=UPI00352B7642
MAPRLPPAPAPPLRSPAAGCRLAALVAGLLVLLPVAGTSAEAGPPVGREVAAVPCPNPVEERGHVSEVTAAGDLVLADGTVLRLAGLAGGGSGADVVWRAELAARVKGGEITFAAGPRRDRYGRRAALVRDHTPAGGAGPAAAPTLQQEVLRAGLALVRPEDMVEACLPAWFAAEAAARRAGRGLWRRLPVAAANIEALRAAQGRFTIVAGRIVDVGKTRRVDYLNFGRVWRQDMTGRVEAEGRAALEARGLTADELAGRWVRLRGTLFEAGGPAITLRRAEQMDIILERGQAPRAEDGDNEVSGRQRPTGGE